MLHKKSQDKTSEHDKLTNDANSDDAVDEAVHYNKSNDDNDSADNDNNNHRFFIPNSKYSTIVIYALLFVVGTILIYKFIGTFNQTMHLIGSILNLISPFIAGAFIAFILFPLVKLLFRKLFKGVLNMKSDKAAKYLSITTAYIIAIGAITILLVFVIPQIYESITEITEQLPVWYNSALEFVGNFENNHQNLGEYVDFNMINERIETALPNIFNYLTGIMSNLIPVIFSTGMAIVKGIISFIISIMVSVYMISDHKNIFYNFKRVLYAVFPKKAADTTRKICRESGTIFLKFMYGKALDSLIIGIICFICMTIFKFPYTVLISVIVGITNMIPYFGPYIGGVMGGIIIVIVNPIQVIFFAILILVIQQFDGLFLGPKILGESTGLKPLWVIFAIVVGGAIFGVLGMFLGVPVMAVICYITNLVVEHFLKKRNISVQPYDSPDEM